MKPIIVVSTPPSLRAQRSNPGATARGPWIASSQGLLAMTGGVIHVPQVDFLNSGRLLSLGCFAVANKKQTVTALILLEKLRTEKEKRRHRFLAKNQVGTCGISEWRFIQGDRPEAGAELAMTGSGAIGDRANGIAMITLTAWGRIPGRTPRARCRR